MLGQGFGFARIVAVAVAVASLALVTAAALAQDGSKQNPAAKREKLDKAAVLLRGPKEPQVREGANLCLEVNDVDAVEMLLKVLGGSQPHHRDIVWEVLPKITDPYARRAVQQELKQNHKDEGVRQWCAELLGMYGDVELAGPLVEVLGDNDARLRAAAARALGKLKFKEAAKRLEKLVADKDPIARANAIEALARIDASAYAATFSAGLHDADGGVRCALLGAQPQLYASQVETTAATLLTDPDWRPRLQCVENLGAIQTLSAVDALVEASGDGRPVVAAKATTLLQKLSEKKFTLKAQWELWWKEARATFQFPDGKQKAETPAPSEHRTSAKYHGIDIASDHVAFVLDKSADMTKAAPGGGTKDEKALAELKQALDHLLGGTFRFNVWTYGDETRRLEKQPIALDEKSEKHALAWTEKVDCKGNKAIWDVLQAVVSDPDVDTVFLLSSGEPEVGLYVHWNRVCEQLADLNRFHKVVVHTVCWSDSKWYREQLEHIALATGGTFKGVE
ncbi:MAG TPA: HEAT repeat domain-containing protein [Planctomycetota bacterium]|jgi:HEAT repeat protein|nr:HEAT repeat domain-containing protein [Planctomycetota bacterium]